MGGDSDGSGEFLSFGFFDGFVCGQGGLRWVEGERAECADGAVDGGVCHVSYIYFCCIVRKDFFS